MKRTLAIATATLATSILGGCAELKVHRLKSEDAANPLVGKVPYYLPRTAVTISGVLTLKKCETTHATAPDRTMTHSLALEFDKAITVGTMTEPDENHRYYVDYESTRSWMKELKFTIETYPNRTLQSYSGELNDQAGAIAVAAAGAIINVAAVAGIGRVPAISPLWNNLRDGTVKPPEYCEPTVLEALKKVAKHKADAEQAQKDRESALAQPAPSEAHLVARLAHFDQKIAGAKAEIAKLVGAAPLARTFSAKWVPQPARDGVPSALHRFEIQTAQIASHWLSDPGQSWLNSANPPADAHDNKAWTKARAPVVLEIILDRPVAGTAGQAPLDDAGGLVVRDAVPGLLRVCDGACSNHQPGLSEMANEKTPRMAIALPQLGQLLVLPQRSALFENSQLSVKMNADGSIASVGYRTASTAATGLAGVSAAAKDQMAATAAANTAATATNAALAAQAQYPNVVNQALFNCLDAANKIRAAGGTPVACQ